MADVDTKLATSLRQAKTHSMYFAFVAKGTEGKLLVDKKKISPKDATEAKKECGGGTIYKGRCKSEDGKMVFEVGKDVPATVSALTKKIIRRDAGLTFDVEYRVAADLTDEENQAETTGEGKAPEKPQNPAATWQKALADIEPAYLQALRDRPAQANQLRVVMGFAQGKAEKGDFPGAIAALHKLTEILGKKAPVTPGDSGKTPPKVGGEPASEWKTKLAEWTPAIKAAMAAKGPNAADIAKLLAQATSLSKPGGDMALALAKLTECHKLATTGATAGRTANEPPSTDLAAEFKTKLADWTPAIKAALAAKGPDAANIAKLLAQATALSKPGGDMPQALAKLTECYTLATAEPEPDGASEDEELSEEEESRRQLNQELVRTEKDLKAVLALKPANAAELTNLYKQASTLAKPGGDIDQAWEVTRELDEKLHEALFGADVDAASGPLPATAEAALRQRWDEYYADWGEDIRKALALKPDNGAEIKKLHDQAVALSKPGGNLQKALTLLREAANLAWGVNNEHDRDIEIAEAEASGSDPAMVARLKLARQQVKAAIAANPEADRLLSGLFLDAWNNHFKFNKPDEARKVLAELEVQLKKAATPAAQTSQKPPQPSPAELAKLEAEWERRVIALEPKVLEAQKTRAGEAKWMTMFMTAQDLGSEGEFAKSLAILDKLEGLLSAPPKEKSPDLTAALATWKAARENAIQQLGAVCDAIAATKDPDADPVIIQLQSIIKNLPVEPAIPQGVAELRSYLEADDVITAAEEVPSHFGTLRIRTPLLKGLAGLSA